MAADESSKSKSDHENSSEGYCLSGEPYVKCLHIIKKALAKEAGLIFYVSHKLCPKGHFSERWTAGGGCRDCRMDRYERDGDKIKARERERHHENREYKLEQSRKYYAANREKMKAQTAKYQKENRDKCNAWGRASYEKHKQKRSIKIKEYYEKNPFIAKASRQRRRCAMANAEGFFTAQEISDLFDKQKGKCALCTIAKLKKSGKDKFHADHIQPISKGGSNWITNIQLTCGPCNRRKHDKDQIKYAQENGKLL